VPPSQTDVVGVSLAGGCVTDAAVASLRRFLAPRRLFLLVASPAVCARFVTLPDVICLHDATILSGVTRDVIADVLLQRYGVCSARLQSPLRSKNSALCLQACRWVRGTWVETPPDGTTSRCAAALLLLRPHADAAAAAEAWCGGGVG
jgi:hypothetical protein